jgi:xanthine dehydrogenase YagS FAD-binding subunit
MRPFSYITPRTAEEAVAAYQRAGPGASYIAGGTSLYDIMKLDIARPTHLIDVTTIEGLDKIDLSGEQLRFEALALMTAAATDPVLTLEYPVVAQGLGKAATQQLRNMATVGGNLLQRTRCMYYRNGTANPSSTGSYPCNKREPGSGCAAIGGIDRGQAILGQSASCTAVSAGDWPVALTAMDASVELLGPEGKRTIAIADFYLLPGNTPHLEFGLRPGELITAILVPKTRAGRRSAYEKIGDRDNFYFAQASAAVALDIDGYRVRRAHIALGGVATKPWRATKAERFLVGKRMTPESALAAGRMALDGAHAGRLNAYKIDLGARMVAEALTIAAARDA